MLETAARRAVLETAEFPVVLQSPRSCSGLPWHRAGRRAMPQLWVCAENQDSSILSSGAWGLGVQEGT